MSLEGQQIGRYRIVRLLGSGGMGEVYLAEDARIEQQVAIKVILAEISPYPNAHAGQEAARLFQREAKAIAKLDHPHILPLYDYGEQHLGNMTVIYLVMPYRREGSLLDWLRQRGQAELLAAPQVAHIVRQAASALQHAHDRQIVHQDVKPSNFLIRYLPDRPERPDLLLADFGVAKLSTATASASQTVRGTPTYMAPEQWAGQPVPATDQYALAVMAYELLTGRPPFQGPLMQVMYQHVNTPPLPPSTHNPHLNTEADTMLLYALAKQPEERFPSIMAFASAFQQAVQGRQGAAAPTPARHGDIQAVLAISMAEAEAGTSRTLTLPGGRLVRVSVPAGVRDGQIVRLDGQGEIPTLRGAAGALILTIQVTTTQVAPSFSTASATLGEETVLTANPETPATSTPIVNNMNQQALMSSAVRPELSIPMNAEASLTEVATPASESSLSALSTEVSLPSESTLPSAKKDASQWFQEGNKHFSARQYKDAILAYSRAINIDPRYADAYHNRGLACWYLRQYQQAILDYSQAITLNPQDADAYNNRGVVYQHLQQHGQAISDYNQAIALNPRYAKAYHNRSRIYDELKQYQLAKSDLEQAVALDPKLAHL